MDRLLPAGQVVIGIDDTIERRWGARISARGIYRDPVRSSKGHFVKTSGLRWLSLMVIVPIPWAARRWALPFLTVLAPSARWSEENGKRHKTLTDWARQAILQTKRWLPDRRLVFVADNGFSALDLLAASAPPRLCDHPTAAGCQSVQTPPADADQANRGRPPLKGRALPKLGAVLTNPKTTWTTVIVSQWYGDQQRSVKNRDGAVAEVVELAGGVISGCSTSHFQRWDAGGDHAMEENSTSRNGWHGAFAGEAWFDPIEAGIRDRVRGFIEELMEHELTQALGRRRYERDAAEPNGYRNGTRERRLLGSFGPVELRVRWESVIA